MAYSKAPAPNKITIIQGGQYGSEAKGLITAKVCHDRKVDICVRTGTVNAGHTIYYNGKPYKMQQLPVGWVNPGTTLVIGPGAFIHPDILERELGWIREATGQEPLVLVDHRCGLHLPIHTDRAAHANRHHKMGATGKGCSEAVIGKINGRGGGGMLFREWLGDKYMDGIFFTDTVKHLNESYDAGKSIVIEGTQGTFLDLHLGPYPYTTHKQTQAANWMAECGLSCSLPVEVILVMRTYPIRVAGNSGPMPGEITWSALAHGINARLVTAGQPPLVKSWALSEWVDAMDRTFEDRFGADAVGLSSDPANWTQGQREMEAEAASELHARAWEKLDPPTQDELSRLFERTTVTNKLRRIARWDWEVARESVMLNRPSSIALTFLNYVFPEARGCTRVTFGNLPDETRERIKEYIRNINRQLGVPVGYVGFGPREEHTFALYPDEV